LQISACQNVYYWDFYATLKVSRDKSSRSFQSSYFSSLICKHFPIELKCSNSKFGLKPTKFSSHVSIIPKLCIRYCNVIDHISKITYDRILWLCKWPKMDLELVSSPFPDAFSGFLLTYKVVLSHIKSYFLAGHTKSHIKSYIFGCSYKKSYIFGCSYKSRTFSNHMLEKILKLKKIWLAH